MSRLPRLMPACCLVLAGLSAAVLLAAHLAGWREGVSVLSGTLPGSSGEALRGVVYVLAWLAGALVAPTLALAALLRLAGHAAARGLRRRGSSGLPR